MLRAASRTLAALLTFSCSQVAADRPDGDVASPDGGTEDVSLSQIGDRSLDQLNPAEARAVCLEDESRWDPCASVALAHFDTAECSSVLASCRANLSPSAARWDCDRPRPTGTCTVSVNQYFDCLDAWKDAYVCENAPYLIKTPAACEPVVAGCPLLRDEFLRLGPHRPCDPPAGGEPPDTNDDIVGWDGCRPLPSRFVVLGDSVAEGWITRSDRKAAHLIARELRDRHAPEAVLEMHARSGALTAELPEQARKVEPGPGHVAVWIWIIGNDLMTALAERNGVITEADHAGWAAAWKSTFDYFADAERFPDGVTFLLNTQYSIWDECANDLTDEEATLREVNRRLFLDVAQVRADTVAIDHYPDWLGHARFANAQGCPHCGVDNSPWNSLDGIHPDDVGHAHIAQKWSVALERMYGANCSR